MDLNLQVPIFLLFLLGLFLLLYWSCIVMTHSSTSLLFVSICTHVSTQIAITICLSFAFYLRLPYHHGFHLDLTILIPLLWSVPFLVQSKNSLYLLYCFIVCLLFQVSDSDSDPVYKTLERLPCCLSSLTWLPIQVVPLPLLSLLRVGTLSVLCALRGNPCPILYVLHPYLLSPISLTTCALLWLLRVALALHGRSLSYWLVV